MVVVGAATRDIDPADPRGWRLGGTVTYASLAMARLGLRVRTLIGVDAEAASAHELSLLLAAGCEIELARLSRGPVFDNQQTTAGRRQVAHSVSDRIRIAELPRSWRAPDGALLGPIAGELGPSWARAFDTSVLVALGWQGLLRRLRPGSLVEHLAVRPLDLICRADLSLVSAEDLSATRRNVRLESVLPRAGQELLVSNGPKPLLYLRRDVGGLRGRTIPATRARRVADSTGAGDVLLATWLAGAACCRAAGLKADPARLLRVAVAAAAAKVEVATLADLPDLQALCARVLMPPAPGPTDRHSP